MFILVTSSKFSIENCIEKSVNYKFFDKLRFSIRLTPTRTDEDPNYILVWYKLRDSHLKILYFKQGCLKKAALFVLIHFYQFYPSVFGFIIF